MEMAKSAGAVAILFVVKSAKGCSFLLQQLEKRGCACSIAASCPEAGRLCEGRNFDLVLCIGQMEGINALTASFYGSSTTLFRCYPVEDSCWWMPAVWRGKECMTTPALRPSEFALILDELVDEIQSGRTPAREISLTSGDGHHRPEPHARWMELSCESPAGDRYPVLPRRTGHNGQEGPGPI